MSNLNDEEREDLVAYLDGELDEAKARSLEARLTVDPQARAEAEALKQAWELLDFLPRPEPSSSFTHRTLERLAIQQPTKPVRTRGVRRWLVGLAWVAALLLACGGGLGLAYWLGPQAPVVREPVEIEEQLVRHLRVIENKRLYDVADDLDFVRALDQPELFGDENPGS